MQTIADLTAPTATEAPSRRERHWLALTLAVQPLLLTVNAVFHPEVDIDGASFLEAVNDGPTQWYIVHLIAALGALLWIPAAFAIRQLIGDGYPRLRAVAMTAVMAGSSILALGFAIEGSVLPLLARADIGDAAALTLAEDFLDTPAFFSILPGFGLSAAGVALLAAILLHYRSPVRWPALVYVLGLVVSTISPPGSPIGPAALAVVAVAAIGMARHVPRS